MSTDPGWHKLDVHQIPPIDQDDIDNYFVHRRNPDTGNKKNCKRQLKKSKKFARERDYIGEIFIHEAQEDVSHLRSTCVPSMKDGLYYMTVSVIKKTGCIYSGICTCKAGQAGTCSHIGALLIRLMHLQDPCTSRLCSWSEPRNVVSSKIPARVEEIFQNSPEKSVRPFAGT